LFWPLKGNSEGRRFYNMLDFGYILKYFIWTEHLCLSETGNEDSSFLRHLELEPTGDSGPGRGFGSVLGPRGGRTPFTTTKRLVRQGNAGFGFSIAWTQPPR